MIERIKLAIRILLYPDVDVIVVRRGNDGRFK